MLANHPVDGKRRKKGPDERGLTPKRNQGVGGRPMDRGDA